jgi:Ion channel
MLIVLLACLVVSALNTVIHYEVLRLLNDTLPRLRIPARPKLLVVLSATSLAHLVEMAVWGVAIYVLIEFPSLGGLYGDIPLTLLNCIYFSAETYTSLGFGDVTAEGHLRLVVGMEALNGLVLIAWSASFTYLSMERFWSVGKAPPKG